MVLLMKKGEVARTNAIEYVVYSSSDEDKKGVYFFLIKEEFVRIKSATRGLDDSLILTLELSDDSEKTVSLMDMQPEQFESMKMGKSMIVVMAQRGDALTQVHEEKIVLI